MPSTVVDLTATSPSPAPGAESTPLKAILHSAINRAQPSRLRVILQQICDNNVNAAQMAEELLLASEEEATRKMVDRKNKSADYDETDEEEDDDEEESEESDKDEDDSEDDGEDNDGSDVKANKTKGLFAPPAPNVKRLRSRYATCANCSEEFDVTFNSREDCIWHPGTLFPSYTLKSTSLS